MNRYCYIPFLALALTFSVPCGAALITTLDRPIVRGSKAVVKFEMKNTLGQKVESARAAVFLVDDSGKMMGQASRWVIGGSKSSPGLQAGATNTFNFVIALDKPLTITNLTSKVTFSRLVLEGGKLGDVTTDVQIQSAVTEASPK